jgi:hypothetical protein
MTTIGPIIKATTIGTHISAIFYTLSIVKPAALASSTCCFSRNFTLG